jgi:hypothetical protein
VLANEERKMMLSFTKIGFWKLLGVGIVLNLAHLALQPRWPELSPHYLGSRPVPFRVLMISEYCFLMAALIAAAGSVYDIYTKHIKGAHPVLIVVAYARYFFFSLWVFR